MLSRRHRRSSWANDERPQREFSMFRTLAGHWQPVAASLRQAEVALQVRTRHGRKERKSTLPTCWSPWLLVK